MVMELGFVVSLEDSDKGKAGTLLSYWGGWNDISERDLKLFSMGAEEVVYRSSLFHRTLDRTIVENNLAVRKMQYCRVNT